MAGDENQTQVVPALNQLIKAINDQVLTANCGGGANITLTCGCGGGSDPPSDGGSEGGSPPSGGWDDTDDPPGSGGYIDRKCKVANITYDDFVLLLEKFEDINLEGLIELGLALSTEVIAAAILFVSSGPIGFSLAVIGAVIALALVFFAQSVNISGLISIFEANQSDIVCIFYNATDAGQAVDDFKGYMSSAGTNAAQDLLINAILTVAATNALFFQNTSVAGQQLEARLDGYTAPIDCGSACSACGSGTPCQRTWQFAAGLDGWTWEEYSSPGATGTGSWAATGELRADLVGAGANQYAWVIWSLDLSGLEVCSAVDDTFSVDIRVANNPNGVYDLYCIYDDATYDSFVGQVITNTSYETYVLVLTTSKPIVELQVINRLSLGGAGGSFDFEMYIDNVDLDLATSIDCP